MGELWRDLVELLRQRPALWLPVLIADLLGYLVNVGRNTVLRAYVLHQTAHQSVLDGAVVHTAMSATSTQNFTIIALLLSWISYLLRILFYSGAFIATAALVQAYRERKQTPVSEVGPALGRHWGGMLELALRGLAVYAIAALLFSWLSPFMTHHGQTALLHNGFFNYGMTLLVLLVLSALLPPVALRVLTGRTPGREAARVAQAFAFTLVVVASLLAVFVNTNSREMAHVPLVARYPMEIIGSFAAALPYVLLFTGLALLARRTQLDANL